MPGLDFENITLNKKTLIFPAPVEALFLQQGMAAKLCVLRTAIAIIVMLHLWPQFYHFKIFSPIAVLFLVLVSLMGAGFVFFKIGYVSAGLAGSGIAAIYGSLLYGFSGLPVSVGIFSAFFLFCISLVSLMVGYAVEYQARTVFLKTGLLQQMKREAQDKRDLKDNEISRTSNSLMLELLAHAEAEARLRESEEKYRNLVTSLPEGILIVRERKIVFVNPGMERLTGYDFHELVGKDAELFFLTHQACDSGMGTMSMDFFIRQDGQKIFIEKSFVEILYGSAPALLFSVRDITEKVMATLEKNRLQKELEKSKKMEAFGILAGGVAHDLNNVLSGLSSIPDLVLMDLPKGSHLIEPVKLIKDSGRKALAIVDELLTLARGSVQTREPVQFNDLVEDYLNSLEFMGLKKNYHNVEIVKNYASDLPLITASKIHMQKIIMNLVSNAVEAVGKKQGKVVLETGPALFHHQRIKGYEIIENGRFLRFTIMDTGHGISKEDRDHIFEPFYSKKILGRSGTGLGLSIVWNAVHDHKGYIHVGSPRGRTFFTLYFPLPDQRDMEAVKADPLFTGTLSDYSGNNEAVLVVEDLASQQKIAANMLKRLGYKVDMVSTGEEAVSYAGSHKIDLVVLDMNLSSGLNGCETYEQLLLIDPKIKAIITSGQSMSQDIEKAKALGAGDFIKKPYSLQSLGLAIEKELKDRDKKA